MIKKSLTLFSLIGICSLLISCAGFGTFVPKGSQPLGTYEGTVGEIPKIIGSVLVQTYHTPAGDKLFKGAYKLVYGGAIFFQGKLKGTTLKGEFDSGGGDVSGQLSSDGSQITGTYYFTESKSTGTWQAERK